MSIIAATSYTIIDLNDPIISKTAPPNPVVGMLWLDTSGEIDTLKRWDGEKWVPSSIGEDELNNIYSNISHTRTEISQTENKITLLVEDKTTIMNGLLTGLQNDISSLITQSSEDIEFKFSQVKNYVVEATGDILESIATIQSYQRFTADGIELGELNSPFKALLGNTKLSFTQSGVEVAFISNNRLYITEARIKDKLAMGASEAGYFEWVVVEGGLGLKWRG